MKYKATLTLSYTLLIDAFSNTDDTDHNRSRSKTGKDYHKLFNITNISLTMFLWDRQVKDPQLFTPVTIYIFSVFVHSVIPMSAMFYKVNSLYWRALCLQDSLLTESCYSWFSTGLLGWVCLRSKSPPYISSVFHSTRQNLCCRTVASSKSEPWRTIP